MYIYNNILPEPQSHHYFKRYVRFIQSIRENTGTVEIHHILPKSLGGSNEKNNLIALTPRQHFIAHWMLWKAYSTKELTYAFFAMCNQNNPYQQRDTKRITSRVYENLKLQCREIISESTIELWSRPDYRQKHIDSNNTSSTKTRRSIAAKKLWQNQEFRDKQRQSRERVWAEGNFNRDHSKCGVKGENNPSKRPEVKAKRTGTNHYTKKEGYVQPICSVCGKSASPSNIKRWHNENCKFNRV